MNNNTDVLMEMATALKEIVDLIRQQQRILTRLLGEEPDPGALLTCDICGTSWPRLEGPTCPSCGAKDEACPSG